MADDTATTIETLKTQSFSDILRSQAGLMIMNMVDAQRTQNALRLAALSSISDDFSKMTAEQKLALVGQIGQTSDPISQLLATFEKLDGLNFTK